MYSLNVYLEIIATLRKRGRCLHNKLVFFFYSKWIETNGLKFETREIVTENILMMYTGASRTHFDWEVVSIELPEYAIFIKLPEFYWMRFKT